MTMTLAMQQGHLKRLTGQARGPMQVARNSAGEKAKDAPTRNAGMPGAPGGNVMTFSMDDLSGEGSLEDQIKEKLKEMGVDADNLEIGSIGGDEKKKKD